MTTVKGTLGLKEELNVSLADIQAARTRIDPYLKSTPLLKNSWLSDRYGCEVFLKLENMQPIGSFKIRGGINKLSQLTSEERKRGVIAVSAGNHGQGVAWSSRSIGISATIVMPKTAPLVKVQNCKTLGAQVILEGENWNEAYQACEQIAQETNRVFIHAYQDEAIIAGQGTCALEILEQLPDVDFVVSAMGGGGLMAGMAIVVKDLKPGVKLVGCQATGASPLVQSIRVGHSIQLAEAKTFADGTAIPSASEAMRKLLAPRLDHVLDTDDENIAAAVLTLMEKAKVVAEGAGAIPLAVLEQIEDRIAKKKVVLVVSGGNIDVNLLARIIDRGMIRAGRRLRANVLISDRPGALARLTDLIAKQGASVLQATHDRSEPSTKIDQTWVFLTLETKGSDHSASIIRAFEDQNYGYELAH